MELRGHTPPDTARDSASHECKWARGVLGNLREARRHNREAVEGFRSGGVDKSRLETFGKNGAPVYTLGLYEEHYFVISEVPVTAFALENFGEVKALPDWGQIRRVDGRRVQRSTDRNIDIFKLSSLLLAKRDALLEPIVYSDAIQGSAYYHKVSAFGSLEYDPAKNTRHNPTRRSAATSPS